MSDETESEVGVPSAPGMEDGTREDHSDLAGENILSFLQKAVGLAEGNSRYAVISRRGSRISFMPPKIGSDS